MRTRKGTDTHKDSATEQQPRGHKRQSSKTDIPPAPEPKPKQAKKTQGSNAEAPASSSTDLPNNQKPRLTSPDLEFDFDHSQIRDPRATPGRVRRPRYDEHDMNMSQEFISRFQSPKDKNDNKYPTYCFYDLYQCHRKGPNGSPTYDSAGFQLDYNKVEKWMKPVSYNKKRMVNSMERSLKRSEEERKVMYDIFFVDGKGPDDMGGFIEDQIKDQVSKDLGVPWHQIDSKQMKKWEERGFEKVKANEWWHRVNDVEKDRFMKMMGGAALRKDL
ncbi:hypothetical protein NW762_005522 [Fusarium torreyae]|uniref:Uncharacterized protein n=1 Tax=Fusarium torreyae TaxID=1237075 RepID=A0A9W8S3C9_9HYPO|nr:hypothetical protein NW762_005522 [Fusarium torreyae]